MDVEDVDHKVTPATTANPAQKSKTSVEDDEKTLHLRIEELDKQGKALFKAKKVSILGVFLFLQLYDQSAHSSLACYLYLVSGSG